jgi:hypothetical protein
MAVKTNTLQNKAIGLQIWTRIVQLPSENLSEVSIYATRSIPIEQGCNVVVRNSAIQVEDDSLRTGKFTDILKIRRPLLAYLDH